MTDRKDQSRSADQPGGGWSTDGLSYLQNKIERQRVFVFHPFIKHEKVSAVVRSPEARLEEAVGLTEAIRIDLVGGELISLREVKPATYIGHGKLSEIKEQVKTQDLDLLVFDCELSPIQQRNLERELKVKVIDRTALILEIFGDRASTKEGELQVELAHLVYQRSRLVRSWTHLERQRGGSGFLGGPGERQIESDRRIIADRITRIKKQLDAVTRTRTLHRSRRQKAPYPIIALVGYTNAGKSTLFNSLTDSDVMAEDMLFATLDPTLRAVDMPSGRKVMLSDTVGFISELPTMLIAAFKATLEEVLEADVIVHVRDASHGDMEVQKQDVIKVLGELGVDIESEDGGTPVIEALNKVDLLNEGTLATLVSKGDRHKNLIPLSAATGYGCDNLIEAIDALLGDKDLNIHKIVDYADGVMQSWIHSNTKILSEKHLDDGISYHFMVDPIIWAKHEKRQG